MRVLSAMMAVLVFGSPAFGQAYCAMRDPVTGIFEAFPEATSYRSITKTVTPDHRAAIAAELPFTLHFNELGRHTVYLAFKDRAPLGMVHVRSERGRYGLVEIGWVLGLDERVQHVYFQRCRDPRADAAIDVLAPNVRGASFEDLHWQLQGVTVDEERMVLRSGLKTLSVTWTAWRDALLPYQAWTVAEANIDGVDTVERRGLDLEVFAGSDALDVDGAAAFAVLGGDGSVLGAVVRLDWRVDDQQLDLWWVIDAPSRVGTLVRAGGLPDETTAVLLESVQGKNRAELESCSTAAGVIATQVLDAVGPIQKTRQP